MLFRTHDIAKALRDSGGQPVYLRFQDGATHVLLPTGQHINPLSPHWLAKGLTGKAARKLRIKDRRQSREAVATTNPNAATQNAA